MKNSLILFTTFILFIFTLNATCEAQQTSSPRFGIKGGVNYSNLYTQNSEDNKMMPGYTIGVFNKMPITERIALQPELYYTTKGAEVTYNNAFVDGTARFKVNYIEMPILLVLNLTDHFNVHVGPYVAYMINGSVKNESNINLFNFEDNINTDDYNRLDAGIAAGAGFDFGRLGIGVRYNYGLTKVGKEKSFLGTTYIFPDANNGVLNLYVSISLL